ncbi:unnamed protein product, partial [Rangifer tarandus platyrhynchus]
PPCPSPTPRVHPNPCPSSCKEPEPVPSTSGESEIAACPPSPIADDLSAPPSPTSSPSSSQQLFLPVHSMSAPACQ